MKCEDLYRGIGGIDEKWLALADEPEKEKESGCQEQCTRTMPRHGKYMV